MSLEKAIAHHKEHRKESYDKAKRVDPTCRNHGTDPWSKEDRLHTGIKANPAYDPADPVEVEYRSKEKESIPKENEGGYGVPHIVK